MVHHRRKKKRHCIPNVHPLVAHSELLQTIRGIDIDFPCSPLVCRRIVERGIHRMICLGIGDLCRSHHSRVQLAWIKSIANECHISTIIFSDPQLCPECAALLPSMDVIVDEVNRLGQYQFDSETGFFMPCCPRFLYHNLLATNWKTELMNYMFIIGNSFEFYAQQLRKDKETNAMDILCRAEMIQADKLDFGQYEYNFDLTTLLQKDFSYENPPDIQQPESPGAQE